MGRRDGAHRACHLYRKIARLIRPLSFVGALVGGLGKLEELLREVRMLDIALIGILTVSL